MAHKVLVIDDERLIIEVTRVLLESKGYAVVSAQDGREGFEVARAESPDLILLDLMMPVLDGWGTLELIRGSDETKNIPVIIFTAKEMALPGKVVQDKGADDYIAKPYEIEDLLAKVRTLLD
jgi:DNA-binding response OmpR family regulator